MHVCECIKLHKYVFLNVYYTIPTWTWMSRVHMGQHKRVRTSAKALLSQIWPICSKAHGRSKRDAADGPQQFSGIAT